MMAAALAEGETVIENAAREPEITDLASCLIAMGAEIDGVGSNLLRVHGQKELRGASHICCVDEVVNLVGGTQDNLGPRSRSAQGVSHQGRPPPVGIEDVEGLQPADLPARDLFCEQQPDLGLGSRVRVAGTCQVAFK